MRLLSLHQAPTRRQAMFFVHSWFGAVVALGVMMVFIALMVKGYTAGKVPVFALLSVGVSGLVVVALTAGNIRRAFQPTNWLFALGPDRVWIKYRSYLNSHFSPDDLQIIELQYDEIEHAGLIRRKEISKGNKGATRTKNTKHVELTLRSTFDGQLQEALEAECAQKGCPDRSMKSRSLHYPVQFRGDRWLRLLVSGIRPGWKVALRELEIHRVAIVADKHETGDYTKPHEDKKQAEEQLTGLIEQGNTVAAIRFARRHYGMGTTEARRFVDELGR